MAPRLASRLVRRSPTKTRSPFKRKLAPRLAANRSMLAADDDLLANRATQFTNIKVAVRVRPENEKEMSSNYRNIIEIVDNQMLVFDPKEENDEFYYHGRRQERRDLNKKAPRDHKFAFDCVFGPDCSNEDVFNATTKELIEVLFNGYNCSVFVYGATGSGKTHTMLGKEENPGITLRTVVEVYNRIEEISEETACDIMISYLEIYNESVYDLINPGTQLQIRDDGKAGVTIPGLSTHKPSGLEGLLRLLQFGNSNRTQHPTDANMESSRSHAVFQVYIRQKSRSSGLSADVKVAKLSMIDLAGSERGSVTSSRGLQRFREGANINKSLLALGNCINALAEGSKYIPYRNSKLTRLLKDSIGGNCRTVMISNISPSSMSFEDTYNTLKYADRAKKIKLRLKENVLSVDFHVAQYAKIVEELQIKLQEANQQYAGLQLECQALKQEKESHVCSSGGSSNHDEELRQRILELEKRQTDYDLLQEKLRELVEANACKVNEEADMEECIKEHIEYIRECFMHSSDIQLTILRKIHHEKKVKRCKTIISDEGTVERNTEKLRRCIAVLDAKIGKGKKKSKQIAGGYVERRNKMEQIHANAARIDLYKQKLLNRHFAQLLILMNEEQNRTEDLLQCSLEQLRKLFLLVSSHDQHNEDIRPQYQELIERIQCSKVQYRDFDLAETNEDTVADRLGPFARLLDLEGPFEDLMDVDNDDDDYECTTQDTEEDSDKSKLLSGTFLVDKSWSTGDPHEEEDKEQNVASESWHPPTPPKLSRTVHPEYVLNTTPYPMTSPSNTSSVLRSHDEDVQTSSCSHSNGDTSDHQWQLNETMTLSGCSSASSTSHRFDFEEPTTKLSSSVDTLVTGYDDSFAPSKMFAPESGVGIKVGIVSPMTTLPSSCSAPDVPYKLQRGLKKGTFSSLSMTNLARMGAISKSLKPREPTSPSLAPSYMQATAASRTRVRIGGSGMLLTKPVTSHKGIENVAPNIVHSTLTNTSVRPSFNPYDTKLRKSSTTSSLKQINK